MNAIVDTAEALRAAQKMTPSKALNFIQCEDVDGFVIWLKADHISAMKFYEVEFEDGPEMCVSVSLANGTAFDFIASEFQQAAGEYFPADPLGQ